MSVPGQGRLRRGLAGGGTVDRVVDTGYSRGRGKRRRCSGKGGQIRRWVHQWPGMGVSTDYMGSSKSQKKK
uniref:Uncharacterized protein n=1 Tax=Leersia perrieri TaxID=77586 RepID=A0A0D9V7V3_9ORYZ